MIEAPKYRVGKPLGPDQNPLRLIGDGKQGYRLEAWHPNGNKAVFAHHHAGDLAQAVDVINAGIAGWPIGPFTVDEVAA